MSEPLVAVRLESFPDPEAVFLALFADARHAFWLDAGPAAAQGWSWTGAGTRADRRDVTRTELDPTTRELPAQAGPFAGGWVGWTGYDAAAERAGAPAVHDAAAPADAWMRVDLFIAFDHGSRAAWAIGPRTAADELARAASRVTAPGVLAPPDPLVANCRHAPAEYAALIERCRDAIREGDAYQLCLTTRFEVSGAVDVVAAYRRLRAATPAHHGGLIVAAGVALASASPERFLEAREGVVRTRPIKGTRPRGIDPAHDAALAEQLRASDKERAENVMIVDLMRNDLSRVCETGSVAVERLLEIESYPAVHQLVSTVSGRLRDGVRVADLLAAAFPAGSMSGAPKLSAMTILRRLEDAPRGVFAGCFGWVGGDGTLDLAMVIRSIVVHDAGAYVGAGGGITWLSDADEEVAEVGIKARGPLAALGAVLPPGW
ncbi:anthranilate synthase component I family protein [Microbacterium hominis]|uniref:Anthranilate synthase component I family protein n=1 Tax=Microbacterium hominis TaxID=162426 RepID=A0A7D4TMY0_9MICO|nr:anthranilate synthase component I family protein [Microbacterium hominis]QKJ19382.1 anthranilate synthase component I family protein [Microbacterium hominis]